MIALLVPEIEGGGSPERHGEGAEEEEEGLVLEYSSSWMCNMQYEMVRDTKGSC